MTSPAKPRLGHESAEVVWFRSGGYCECGCGQMAEEIHHIWNQQTARRWGRADLIDDPRAVVAVASSCHSGHTSGLHRFPRSICKRAEQLPMGAQQELHLERHYGAR